MVQPPTFAGTSGLGYAVTAAGNLVRFDLDDPAAGATVVYSGQQVVAAQALASGQVVAALANGVVDLLTPQANGLVVQSQLLADGAMPAAPSSIDVVTKANGQFDVLVSSAGLGQPLCFLPGRSHRAGRRNAVSWRCDLAHTQRSSVPGATPGPLALLSSSVIATSASATAASASTSTSTSSGALSVTATSSVGLSLGGFSSLKSSSSSGNEEALLVSVEGNTYLSVPVLGFGAENDEVGNGDRRMPWLAAEHPVGDTSPLSRFLIGLDEALRNYRGTDDATLPRSTGRSDDIWNEDLFFRHLPVPPQTVAPEKESSKPGTDPRPWGPIRAMASDRGRPGSRANRSTNRPSRPPRRPTPGCLRAKGHRRPVHRRALDAHDFPIHFPGTTSARCRKSRHAETRRFAASQSSLMRASLMSDTLLPWP